MVVLDDCNWILQTDPNYVNIQVFVKLELFLRCLNLISCVNGTTMTTKH